MISGTECYIHSVNKERWVKDHYDINLENYCVCSQDMKLAIMIALAEASHYENEEILLVDDFYRNLERATDHGFQACTPMEVVNYINQLNSAKRG